MRIGVDAGGTFTDFIVLQDDGLLQSFKLRSNPRDPASVILSGIQQAAGASKPSVVHGSTVATNALLERKGARTAFVTTAGFEDLIQIGRQNRPDLYSLTPGPRRSLVEPTLCFGVAERAYFDGTIVKRPTAAEMKRLRLALQRAGVESIAICFLHSYQNPDNEVFVAEALQGLAYLCCSHDISPEFREYERSTTTVINAYVGPLMDRYLRALEQGKIPISIMQSNGGFISSAEARRHAVRTVLSGPAGGVVGAIEMARLSGFQRVMGFDMGGTSTDVSLSDGEPRHTTETTIDGFPIRVPMLDIHTVGAGGGSIARVDEGGLLRVGPQSAGSDPGPACYGSGDLATVTDAHVVLGRIESQQLLGGAMTIDVDRANAAVDLVAKGLGVDRTAAAAGIIRVANANMERAIRVVSVERGYDPYDFALVAFGGCGGLHACEIAAELGIPNVIVPRYAGALSALGMLMADNVRDYAAGALHRRDLEKSFAVLERQARKTMPGAELHRSADLRYAGQSYELNVQWNAADPGTPFHVAHKQLYGYSTPERAIEIVTIRVRAKIRVQKPRLANLVPDRTSQPKLRRVYVDAKWRKVPVWQRGQITTAQQGPALVLDYGSTTLMPAGWQFRLDKLGNLIASL